MTQTIMSEQESNNLLNFIVATIESMRVKMTANDDLASLEESLTNKIEVEITAVRGDIEQVHLRFDTIEHALSSRF